MGREAFNKLDGVYGYTFIEECSSNHRLRTMKCTYIFDRCLIDV